MALDLIEIHRFFLFVFPGWRFPLVYCLKGLTFSLWRVLRGHPWCISVRKLQRKVKTRKKGIKNKEIRKKR